MRRRGPDARRGSDLRFYDYEVLKAHGRRLGLHGPLGPDDEVIDFNYPPWLAVAYVPVALLSWDVARSVWFAIGAAASLGACALLGATCAPPGHDRRTWAVGAAAALCLFFPFHYGLMTGQSNDLQLLAIAGSLALHRAGRPFAAGLCLSVAGLWKVITVFPALYLLARRDGRALAGLAAGCGALLVLSLPFVGAGTWADWVARMRDHNAVWDVAPRNHGILSAALTLFRGTAAGGPAVHAPEWVVPFGVGLALLAAALTALTLRGAGERDDRYAAVRFTAPLVLGVLLVPKSWEHYGVYLLPVLLALAAAVTRIPGRRGAAAAAVLGALFAAFATLLSDTRDYEALKAMPLGAVVMSAKCWAGIALLGLAAWVVRTRRATGDGDGPREDAAPAGVAP